MQNQTFEMQVEETRLWTQVPPVLSPIHEQSDRSSGTANTRHQSLYIPSPRIYEFESADDSSEELGNRSIVLFYDLAMERYPDGTDCPGNYGVFGNRIFLAFKVSYLGF